MIIFAYVFFLIVLGSPIVIALVCKVNHAPSWTYCIGFIPMVLLLVEIFIRRLMIALNIKWKPYADFCCFMGWHWETTVGGSDGCSVHGKCLHCNKEGMYDSQGNFF